MALIEQSRKQILLHISVSHSVLRHQWTFPYFFVARMPHLTDQGFRSRGMGYGVPVRRTSAGIFASQLLTTNDETLVGTTETGTRVESG